MKSVIIVPTYNASSTVAETLHSIQKNIELNPALNTKVWLADDCSLDNTLQICNDTWHLDKSILEVYPSEKNQGERENINRILPEVIANFDWAYILHADDIAKDNWISTIHQHILLNPTASSITTSYDVLYENGRIEKGEEKEGTELITGNKRSIRHTLTNGTWFHISGCAINCNTFEKIGFFQKDLPQYGDMEFILRAFLYELDILYIPSCLTLYRQTSSSVSSNSFKKNIDILEFSSLVAHFKSYFNEKELLLHNTKFQTYLNRRIARSIVSLNYKRLWSALNLKKYVRGILVKNKPAAYTFPYLPNLNG